jgi:antitoxin ParD1/3/4
MRQAKLDALRRDITEGLDSGPSEALDMDAIIREARQTRDAAKNAQHREFDD